MQSRSRRTAGMKKKKKRRVMSARKSELYSERKSLVQTIHFTPK